MQDLIDPLLQLLGVVLTAGVTWMVARRSYRVQKKRQDSDAALGLMDRYVAEVNRVDKALEDRRQDIELLTRQNSERDAQISSLREDMAQVRRDHSLETTRMEISLSSFRFYIGTLLDWINRRFEEGELNTDAEIPEPPTEYHVANSDN